MGWSGRPGCPPLARSLLPPPSPPPFLQVSLSHVVMPMVKMVARGFTAAADAYLTPHIMRCARGGAAWGPVSSSAATAAASQLKEVEVAKLRHDEVPAKQPPHCVL